MSAPTVSHITAAARATGRTSPRMPRAMLAEVIRSIAEAHPRAVCKLALELGWDVSTVSSAACRDDLNRKLDGDGVPALTEAEMRGVLAELLIYTAPDEHTARARWGAVFGLCEAP